MLPAPKPVAITAPTSTAFKAQVAPTLRSQRTHEYLPPPAESDGGEYVVPDDDRLAEHNLTLGENT